MSDEPIHNQASENTPLLSRDDEERTYSHANGVPASDSLRSQQEPKKPQRWATVIALSILSLAVLAILGLGFAAPAVVEEYAKEALVFEPTNLSIDRFTGDGVVAEDTGGIHIRWVEGAQEKCERSWKSRNMACSGS